MQSCAILSTHDLSRIRYNASDDILWRNTVWTSFWEKDIWIIPIHRPAPVGHWVFCAVYFATKELHLFDSLAARRPWQNDVKVSDHLSCSLLK
jgi:Ulp1 family protease